MDGIPFKEHPLFPLFPEKKLITCCFEAIVEEVDPLTDLLERAVGGRGVVALIDAKKIAGEGQIITASILYTLISNFGKKWIRKPSLMLTAILAGTRQVSEALRSLGLREGRNEVVLAIISSSEENGSALLSSLFESLFSSGSLHPLKFEECSEVLDGPSLTSLYGIPAEELRALSRSRGLSEKELIEEAIIEEINLLLAEVTRG